MMFYKLLIPKLLVKFVFLPVGRNREKFTPEDGCFFNTIWSFERFLNLR